MSSSILHVTPAHGKIFFSKYFYLNFSVFNCILCDIAIGLRPPFFASRTSNVRLILFSTRKCDISPCRTKLSASCVIITASPSRSCVARPARSDPLCQCTLNIFYPGENIFTQDKIFLPGLCCVRVLIRVANARVSNMSAHFHSLHSAAARTQDSHSDCVLRWVGGNLQSDFPLFLSELDPTHLILWCCRRIHQII